MEAKPPTPQCFENYLDLPMTNSTGLQDTSNKLKLFVPQLILFIFEEPLNWLQFFTSDLQTSIRQMSPKVSSWNL